MGVNGKQDETRNIIFQQKNKKNRENTREKNQENTKKKQEKKTQKITRNTELRQDKILAQQDFDEILGSAENENNNKVFSNVPKRQFEGKNEVSMQPYLAVKSTSAHTQFLNLEHLYYLGLTYIWNVTPSL